jgi:hypothetical protein
MNTVKIGLGIIAAVTLVVFGLGAGWLVWGRWLWQPGMMWYSDDCSDQSRGIQDGLFPGMMDRWNSPRMRSGMRRGWYTVDGIDCPMLGVVASSPANQIGLREAQRAVEEYIADWSTELEIAELMEFEHNYYAIVREHNTGMGAMELLINKSTGYVAPEMGPNMMWNARYGMHPRQNRIDTSGQANRLSEAEAVALAQQWLDEHKAGARTEGHADPFYGYYTIHTLRDEQIEGMLSVHGQTGQVWYHTWHGTFVQMLEGEGLDH